MQTIAPITPDQLRAIGQEALMKLEAYVKGSWVNLRNLFSSVDLGLVGYWPLDEGAGMVAHDKSRQENDGSLENMTEEDWVDGKVGKCLDFDGEDDKVSADGVITDVDLTTTGKVTLCGWFKRTAASGDSRQGFCTDGLFNNYLLINFDDSFVRGMMRGANGTYPIIIDNTDYSGEWVHICVVKDGEDLELFVNGVSKGKDDTTGLDANIVTTSFDIGWVYSNVYAFDGLIDEVRVYSRALTASEIKALYELKGKNYVENISISLGGASMTPAPVGGAWSASLSNENSIFHPNHPTSAFYDYLVTGRKVRISIGAKYGGTDYYWQRMIGYMDEPKFSAPDYKVEISGGDYMKLLQETELRSPDNYWGTSQTFSSIASDGLVGSELYNEVDAMDINNEADNVTNWTPFNCTFVSVSDAGGGSTYVGKMINSDVENNVENVNVGALTYGKEYKACFKYKRVTGAGALGVWFYQYVGGAWKSVGHVTESLESGSYASAIAYIRPLITGALKMMLNVEGGVSQEFRIDQISIKEFIPYEKRYYELLDVEPDSKGPYYVTLDRGEGAGAEPVWQGEEDEGWYYAEDAEPGPDPPAHPAEIVFFDINKVVPNGTDNLVIYYFTTESPENVIADILVKVKLYADRAAALAAMEYTATEITIDKVWFKPGSTCLNAIKKLCERCDYRFHFKYDGTPVFKPKPAPGATSFTFTDPKQIASFSTYQDRNEIKNRIVIEGMKQAEPVNKEETMPPELKGEAHDQTSIDEYGERTLTIKNHLFQTQAAIDAMKAILLAEYKDPKWYTDLEMPFLPVPLEIGDKIQWEERFSPVLDITETGVIRDIKIDNLTTTYVCEL